SAEPPLAQPNGGATGVFSGGCRTRAAARHVPCCTTPRIFQPPIGLALSGGVETRAQRGLRCGSPSRRGRGRPGGADVESLCGAARQAWQRAVTVTIAGNVDNRWAAVRNRG